MQNADDSDEAVGHEQNTMMIAAFRFPAAFLVGRSSLARAISSFADRAPVIGVPKARYTVPPRGWLSGSGGGRPGTDATPFLTLNHATVHFCGKPCDFCPLNMSQVCFFDVWGRIFMSPAHRSKFTIFTTSVDLNGCSTS